MEELKENNAPRDRAILVGLSSPRLDRKENADEESLEELAALVETAGGVSVGVVATNAAVARTRTHSSARARWRRSASVKSHEATMAIFDNDLSPSQMRVLCEEFGVQVLDRSGLILDIFAQRAKTKEGRLAGRAGAVSVPAAAPDRYVDASGASGGHGGKGRSARRAPAKRSLRPTAATSTERSTS